MSEKQSVITAKSGQFRKQSLVDTHIHVAVQWDYDKNEGLTPDAFTAGSHRVVWWRCPLGDDHVWRSEIRARVKGTGCQICNKRKPSKSNSLLISHPHIAAEWDPKKIPKRG